MKKMKIILIISAVVSLCLEIFGKGAVCKFATPEETIIETYSYFSLVPYGYANFAPFITAVLTILIFVFAVLLFTPAGKKITGILKAVSIISVITSVIPLVMFGMEYYNAVSFFISLLMIIQLVVIILLKRKKGADTIEA